MVDQITIAEFLHRIIRIFHGRICAERSPELFEYDGDVLFYFSGHGSLEETGGYLVTQDGGPGDPGINTDEIITLANNSRARSVLVIIDCCFSGTMGNVAANQGGRQPQAQLREGLTILAALRPTEPSMEVGGEGVFTELVVSPLKGGAANAQRQSICRLSLRLR